MELGIYKKVDLFVTGEIEMWKVLFHAPIFLSLLAGYKRTFGKTEEKIMEENRWEWKDFGKIRTCKDLEAYLSGREYSHGDYCHYTGIDTINKILEGKTFWLTSVTGFNDTLDTEQFGEAGGDYFSLCFSTGVNENLPLWYLYSGINGKGGRIQMTKDAVRSLIENGRFRLCRAVSKKCQEFLKLELGNDMDLEFRDMVYVREPEGNEACSLKYNTMTNYQVPKEEFRKYKENHCGFWKGLIWYYEKETRLLARVKGEAKAHLNQWREADRDIPDISYRIELSFDEALMKRLKIMLAPNIKEAEIAEILKDYEGIQNLLKLTSPIRPSGYAGTVQFNLCKNCEKNRKENR